LVEPSRNNLRKIATEAFMHRNARKGGVIAVFVVGLLIAVSALILSAIFVASNVRLQHRDTAEGSRVRVETPFGDVNIDARDTLKPESAGMPVYPGAFREHGDDGGVVLDFDSKDGRQKQFSVVAAQYSTTDSPDEVREFYRSHLPNWVVTDRLGHGVKFELSNGGYRRIVAIEERRGRTHIGIVAIGEPAVN
jgi:hypothetical protein